MSGALLRRFDEKTRLLDESLEKSAVIAMHLTEKPCGSGLGSLSLPDL
jgi:hypothetical protein